MFAIIYMYLHICVRGGLYLLTYAFVMKIDTSREVTALHDNNLLM